MEIHGGDESSKEISMGDAMKKIYVVMQDYYDYSYPMMAFEDEDRAEKYAENEPWRNVTEIELQ